MAFNNDQGGGGFQRPMFTGDWECSQCHAKIDKLPFEPDPARLNQLKCRDCYKSQPRSFGGGNRFQGGGDRFQRSSE